MTNLYETVEAAHMDYKRAEAKIDADLAAERVIRLASAREALSRVMHSAHADGLPKDQIRRATHCYGNSYAFNPLWDAYTPEVSTDLRRGTKPVNGADVVAYRWENADLLWTHNGETLTLVNYHGDAEWDNWETHFEALGGEGFAALRADVARELKGDSE